LVLDLDPRTLPPKSICCGSLLLGCRQMIRHLSAWAISSDP
jgi:hypothetical protein